MHSMIQVDFLLMNGGLHNCMVIFILSNCLTSTNTAHIYV